MSDYCATKTRQVRRPVTDADFKRAYYGASGDDASLRAAADNRNVIAAVLKQYVGKIPHDELESCGMTAMWRTLQYHQPDHPSRQKFTTSLHRFAKWECLRELRRVTGGRGRGRFVRTVP